MKNSAEISPHQYIREKGWGFTQIEDTAQHGISLADLEILGDDNAKALLAYCRDRVMRIYLDALKTQREETL